MARSNSLLSRKKFPVRARREFPSTALKLLPYLERSLTCEADAKRPRRAAVLALFALAAAPPLSPKWRVGAVIHEVAALPWSLLRALITRQTGAACARTRRRQRVSHRRSSGTARGC
jgi:hypothetical protein